MKKVDKRIRYHEHAEHRLAERGVTKDHVADALRYPGAVRPAKQPGAKRFEKAVSKKRRVVVIAEEKSTEFWVISAWWN